jgi:hypothetical protein
VDTAATGLLVFGYPTSIIVIVRWLPVVRERRWRWLIAHHAGVAAIVAGWAIKDNTRAVVVNATWLAVSSVWFALGGRRHASTRSRP